MMSDRTRAMLSTLPNFAIGLNPHPYCLPSRGREAKEPARFYTSGGLQSEHARNGRRP